MVVEGGGSIFVTSSGRSWDPTSLTAQVPSHAREIGSDFSVLFSSIFFFQLWAQLPVFRCKLSRFQYQTSIHLLYTLPPPLRVSQGVCWSPSQLSWGEGGVTPQTSRQFITGPDRNCNKDVQYNIFTLTNTPMDNLEFAIGLTSFFLDHRRNQWNLERTHTD